MPDFNNFQLDEESSINFFAEDVSMPSIDEDLTSSWIEETLQNEKHQWTTLNFIFCSDEYLHKINIDYLDHDTYTDIITFPYSTSPIEGDIYISVERILENAKKFDVSAEQELHRIIIHGVLHLMGYGDKNLEDKKQMTLKENQYLSQLKI